MKSIDRIYGEIEITDEIIVDLIHSQPLQRLHHISQDGATHYLQPVRTVTRFEHSVGTWFLAKKFHKTKEEQIASLLHDIPHTAFSHVADFVMQDKNHEYHDRFFEKVVMGSDIPNILERHGIEVKNVLAKEKYPLLDNKLPDISVDRWDYFLRDGSTLGVIPHATVKELLDGLQEEQDMFYFEDQSLATLAAILFMNCSRLIWLDPTSHGSFFLLSKAIKIAMESALLSEEELFGTDEEVMSKLKNFKNHQIDEYLERLFSGKQFHYASKEYAEFYGPNKPRYIDPYIKMDGKFYRVSEVVPGMKEYFEEFVSRYNYLGVIQEK